MSQKRSYVLGCDVCKTKIDVSLIDEQGTELWYDKVPNDHVSLAEYLLTITGNYPEDDLLCVVESTGTYHYLLAEASYAVGIPCRIFNPILTKQYVKTTIRGSKTDRTDALMIARLGLRGEGRLYLPDPYSAVKYYVRGQQQLGKVADSLRRHDAHLQNVLGTELSQEAQDIMDGIQEQLKAARKQFVADIAAIAPADLMRRLQTIPGVGPFIAASLIGEIQTMERFNRAKSLIAYAGLDPRVRQSGHTLNNTGKLTKRGSNHLRYSLFIAASVARQYDPNFQALYEKKRTEGKRYKAAVIVVARKLLMVIRAIWLSEQDYDASQWNNSSET